MRRPGFASTTFPAASIRSFAASAFVPSSFTTRPFTRTCPLAINSSACRREAIPARAIIFCNLSCMVSFLQSLVGARYIVPFFRLDSTLCLSCGCFFVFSLHPYFATALPCLFTPPPPLPSALRRFPPPASPHYSPPSPPAILLALPSPRGSRSRSRRSAPALRFLRSPLATRHSPLPPYRSRALPAQAPQTPSSSATLPGRSIQIASKILSTSYTKSAAPSLPSAPPW